VHILYEDAGELKVGSVLAEAPASFQVESPHGRRTKVKATTVLLSFERPAPAELLAEAEKFAAGVDAEFLWQCAPGREFGFEELAREYVGRAATPVESAGILVKLHSAPIFFHRRSRGRFQPAPQETVRLALAAVEKKRRTQERIGEWAAALGRGECPPEIAALKDELLYAPDRNKPETKAFEQACTSSGLTSARMFERCGLLADPHEFHLRRFLHEFKALGADFASHDVPPDASDLPLSEAVAFSLDDVGTTEIDDAFSLRRLAGGLIRVGIHIAAPAIAVPPGSPLDGIARERLSTAYMPGGKFTMLPDAVIARFSLDEASERAAVSLYFDLDPEAGLPVGRHTRLERIKVGANLRHSRYEVLNEVFPAGRSAGLPLEEELRTLWRCALHLEAKRGKPSTSGAALDYSFYVEAGTVRIVPRKRGSPLDKLVSEMMILVNTSWGELLAERDVAAIYRVQSTGKVRFSVHPEPHEGLGVSCYAWMSSPLRRYVDLLNQWQLLAALSGRKPPFARNSDGLLSALRAFEVTHARYDEHQRGMESYWTLRWLVQEKVAHAAATVIRENLVRLEGLPLVTRVASLPELPPGTRVRLEVKSVDLLERTVELVYRDTLEAAAGVPEEPTETGEKA